MSDEIAGYLVNFRKRLGKGAIGSVYMATDKDGTRVAAKEVDSLRSKRSAVRELQNAQKHLGLDHENIVKIFDIYNEEDIWVFMEYCEGGDLNNYSCNHYEELQDNKVNVMTQITRGLVFLHESKIAHRDIKPENILIQPAAGIEFVTVKLTDFGLAKFHEPDESTSAMETQLGTRQYMAPEFWDKNAEDKIRYHKDVDVFALGLTFQAIIKAEKEKALKPNIEDIKETEWALPIGQIMLNRFRSGQPKLTVLLDRPEDNSEMLTIKALIRKSTSFSPANRPSTQQILECLESLLKGSPDEVDRTIIEETEKDSLQDKQVSSDLQVRVLC